MSKRKELTPEARRNFIRQILFNAPEEGLTTTEIHKRLCDSYGETAVRKTTERAIDHLSETDAVYQMNAENGINRFAIKKSYSKKFEFTINEEQLQIMALALGLLQHLGPNALSLMAKETESVFLESLPDELKKDFEVIKGLQSISSSIAGKSIVEKGENIPIILAALRKGRMIECEYYSKGRGALEARELGPAFIELFGGSPYLLAEDPHDENKLKRFKLSRMDKVKILETRYTAPEKDECLRHLNSFEGVGGNESEIFNIVIKGTEKLAEHFEEFQLHPSQILTKHADTSCTLEFRMPESFPFYRYMAGFGGWITEIEPKEVMWQIRAIWRKGTESMGFIVDWQNK